MFATAKLGKRSCARSLMGALTFDTQLHYGFSMRRKMLAVKVMETVANDSQLQLSLGEIVDKQILKAHIPLAAGV